MGELLLRSKLFSFGIRYRHPWEKILGKNLEITEIGIKAEKFFCEKRNLLFITLNTIYDPAFYGWSGSFYKAIAFIYTLTTSDGKKFCYECDSDEQLKTSADFKKYGYPEITGIKHDVVVNQAAWEKEWLTFQKKAWKIGGIILIASILASLSLIFL